MASPEPLSGGHQLEDEEALLAEVAEPQATTPRLTGPHVRLTALFGLALLGVAVLLLSGRSHGLAAVSDHMARNSLELAEESQDPCGQYPFISLGKVIHSNLGGQGPDTGAEGIVYTARDIVPGFATVDLIVVVNASDSYKAGHPKYNGIHGKYGLITMKAGHEAAFTFRVYDADTMQPRQIAKQAFTFFDLDQSSSGNNREYVRVANASQMWLTRNTEIEVTDLSYGTRQFMSSRPGNGADNPRDPTALTVQQKDRAVSLVFEDFSELTVTLGCTEGSYARYFMFAARPSLLCARTLGRVDGDEDAVVPVDPTTPAPTLEVTTAEPAEECLYVLPIIKYCIPQAWKFWSS